MKRDNLSVVSFSGGKDSTAMLLLMIENNIPIDMVVNIDTTKEFPEMYDHIEKVKKYISPIQIMTKEIPFDSLFEHYSWPDISNRWCTDRKIKMFNRIIKQYRNGKNLIRHIGIALDESHRIETRIVRHNSASYPLIDFNMTEADALQFCYDRGFTWNGLYKKFSRASCYCCPLSNTDEMRVLYHEYPDLWKKVKDMDTISFRKFWKDKTLTQLENLFKKEDKGFLSWEERRTF